MPLSSGSLVTETLGFDGGRRVSAYVPASAPAAVVYAADGQLTAPWGRLLETGNLPPVLVVGTHRVDDEVRRIQEYVAGTNNAEFSFDPKLFAAHESFFVDEVQAWVRKRFDVSFPRRRTAVYGASAGGELALAMGIRHPEIYGTVLCASPGGGYRPSSTLLPPLPNTYFVFGRDEPFFQENALRWAEALRNAGADVVSRQRDGAHGDPFWREEFREMVAWAFAPRPAEEGVSARER